MRTKGSCRFAAYYKVERYDDKIGAWRPIQKSFPTQKAAETFAAGTGYAMWRLLRVTEKGVEIDFQ
jgi:hypothetical protein